MSLQPCYQIQNRTITNTSICSFNCSDSKHSSKFVLHFLLYSSAFIAYEEIRARAEINRQRSRINNNAPNAVAERERYEQNMIEVGKNFNNFCYMIVGVVALSILPVSFYILLHNDKML